MPSLILDLDGTIRLLDGSGADLAPPGAMLRAVLVALGVAPRHRLTREALKALLWRDRMPAQADGSLRRALSDLRARLGPHSEALESSDGWIGLDPARVSVRLPADQGDLAQGIALRVPAFAAWLSQARRLPEPTPPRGGVLRIALSEEGTGGHPICDIVLRDACRRVACYVPVEIARDGIGIVCTAIPGEGDRLMIEVETRRDGMPGWSQIVLAGADELHGAAAFLSGELTGALLGDTADLLTALTSFDWGRLAHATTRLRGETMLRPEVSEAMLGFARLAAWIDRFDGDEAMEEAHELALRSMRSGAAGSVVDAMAALVLVNRSDPDMAHLLARRALRRDPLDPLVRHACAMVHAKRGETLSAARLAGAAGSSGSTLLSDEAAAMAAAMTAVAIGDEASALAWSRRAWLLAPRSRPALRYVAALAFRAGDEAMAAEALRALEVEEPGFSAAAMAEPDYPVDTLREAGLLDVAWARHLGGARRGLDAQRRGRGG